MPFEARVNNKKFIVIKTKDLPSIVPAHCEPIFYTRIEKGQWEYSLPLKFKKSHILEIQFNDKPVYYRKLKVKHLKS